MPADLDWQNFANPMTTTIFYMGGRTASQIRAQLLAAGMAPVTPSVIVSAVTRSGEKRWCGVVNDLADAMDDIGVNNPVIIGVGQVFADARISQ